MDDARHVEAAPPLHFLMPVLDTWLDLLRTTSRSFPQDASFWWIEQTLVSLLSVAAWKHGIPAITEAKLKRQQRDGATSEGHVDLLMLLHEPDVDTARRVAFEAKIKWLSGTSQALPRAQRCLQEAREEATTVAAPFCDLCLALAFLVPWPNLATRPERGLELMEAAVNAACALDVPIKAWYCDSSLKYPGVVLLATRP
jgi:hypothetical protein